MSAVSPTADRPALAPARTGALAAAAAAAVLVLGAAALTSPRATALLLVCGIAGVVLALGHRVLLQWRMLVASLVLMIMLVPIRRYSLPGALPIDLEPYRLLVIVVVGGWVGSLLVQRDTVVRRSGLEGPIVAFSLAMGASVVFNVNRISDLDVMAEVVKTCTFFVSFVLVTYLCASVVATRSDRLLVLRVLVAAGAVVAACAVVESRTGFNPFDRLHRFIPILNFDSAGVPLTDDRGGRVRAYASAQHSIALGAALAMLVPLAMYLARRTGNRRWWIACGLLGIGVLATVSRTAILMLAVEAIVLLALKPAEMRRLLPLVVPALVVVQFAMPGTLSSLKTSFFPEGGLIAQQQGGAGTYGSGRIADLGPGLQEWAQRPLQGQGFGSRITNRSDPKVNAPILDNQWLGLLLEVGAFGFLAFLWLIVRATRRLGRIARRDRSPDSWLAAALASSIAAFGVGMFTYDAFSFIQAAFLLFILLGLAAPELRTAFVRYPLTSRPAPALTAVSAAG